MSKIKNERKPSSGNVFADLGLPNADELLAKAKIAVEIKRLVEINCWSEQKVAALTGVHKSQIHKLINIRPHGLSLAQIEMMLKTLVKHNVPKALVQTQKSVDNRQHEEVLPQLIHSLSWSPF